MPRMFNLGDIILNPLSIGYISGKAKEEINNQSLITIFSIIEFIVNYVNNRAFTR